MPAGVCSGMTNDQMIARTTVAAPAEAVFAVLADPSSHQRIDGTGWVREALDGQPLSHPGQVFRMAMYHDNHPDGNYVMANKVTVLDSPRAIAWEPGQMGPDGKVGYGGLIWRYDLAPAGAERTDVTLTYDWSAVSQELREHIGFPPFDRSHLEHSLAHLAELARS
jgi:Polyketide cyclase / dehydrase and lipid transport